MNKQERKLKGQAKFKRRCRINKAPLTMYCYKAQAKPCSCDMCSASKRIPYKPKHSDLRKAETKDWAGDDKDFALTEYAFYNTFDFEDILMYA